MKVFVSFDFDHDRQYKYTLDMWNGNENIDFNFDDKSSTEINSWNVDRIKAALTMKIKQADVVLVIVGSHANSYHKDCRHIGNRNWQNWEIAKAKELGKKLVGVKLNHLNTSPDELLGSGATWAMSFSKDAIVKALNNTYLS